MRVIRLTDGTSYEVDWCNGDKGVLYLNLITRASFVELAEKFSNPELTNRIEYRTDPEGENTKLFEGYTSLKMISYDNWRTGTVLITLLEPDKAV